MEDATANKNQIIAAIDLGSNTFRLLVVKTAGKGSTVLFKRNATVRLGLGLATARTLAPDSMGKALAVLAEFKETVRQYRVGLCRCCGTEALRRADNVEEFLAMAAAVLGVEVEVVAGRDEAMLICRGVLAAFPDPARLFPLVMADVGGGSTELIYLRDYSAKPLLASLPAGAVFFSELAASGGLPSAFALFRERLRGFVEEWPGATGKVSVLATGGTATAMAVLDLALAKYDGARVHGHKLTCAAMAKISDQLQNMSAAARDLLPGLEEGRGNILVAGLEIYQEILATIAVDVMIISDAGLLEGIMLSCLEPESGPWSNYGSPTVVDSL